METKLRLYNIINLGSDIPTIHIPVDTIEEAVVIGMRMAKDQLERSDISSNVFGLQIFRDGEWDEWFDPEDGRTFEEYWDDQEALQKEIFGT